MILYNHGTQFAQIETPSGGFDVNGLFALDGFVVVAADYYGFGATQDNPQAYLSYYNAVTSLELLSAAVRDFGLQGIPQYVCGHSEGGTTSAAVAQEWSTNGSAYPDVKLTRVYAVNGPYDIHHTFSEFRDLDYAPGIIGGLALASISYNMILGEDLYKNFVDLVKNNNGENRARKYLASGDYGTYGSPLVFGEYSGMPNALKALETGKLTDEALEELTTPGLDYGTFPGFSMGDAYCNITPHEEAFDCENKKFYNTLDPANTKYIYNLNSTDNYTRVVKSKKN